MGSDFQERFIRVALDKGCLDEAAMAGALQALNRARASGAKVRLHEFLLQRQLLTREQLITIRRAMAQEGVRLRVNDYDVISRIGRGGMGVVYLARQRSLDRLVALKVLASHLAAEPRFVARLLREASLAARLNHPNVVRVFDVGQWRQTHYIVMEYVQGRSLDRLIRSGELLSESSAAGVLIQMADALQAARQLGIVHRDIKPGNILLAGDGIVKLADLGVACVAGEPAEPDVGTPYYLSPEQARNDPLLDIRADIYSLGCALFHAMTGRPPYHGPTAIATVTMHLDSTIPDIRELRPEASAELAALLRRMMAKLPQDRPDPVELMAELRKLHERAAMPASPSVFARWAGRLARWFRRK